MLAFLSGEWSGAQDYVEGFYAEGGCNRSNAWTLEFITVFGLAKDYTQRARQVRKCDPMLSTSWWYEIYSYLWSGDAGEALEVAREGLEIAPDRWVAIAMVRALVADGRYEEADQAIANLPFLVESDTLRLKMLESAAVGDSDGAQALYEQILESAHPFSSLSNSFYALVGDRENANHRAAQIDSRPFGPQSLLQLTFWCGCGAPFDLEATPNFAGRVKAAGIPWPPASPIKFPLKDW